MQAYEDPITWNSYKYLSFQFKKNILYYHEIFYIYEKARRKIQLVALKWKLFWRSLSPNCKAEPQEDATFIVQNSWNTDYFI